MMCRKRPYSIMNSSYGCIRSPILCAPAFNAVPWLGEAACIPVVQYTAPESTVTLKKRHPVKQAMTPDPVKPGSGNFHKIKVLPDNVPMSPIAKMAQSSTPPADVHTDHLSLNMAQLHSWGRREHGMLGRGAALFLTFFGGMCNIPTHQHKGVIGMLSTGFICRKLRRLHVGAISGMEQLLIRHAQKCRACATMHTHSLMSWGLTCVG